ncbi:MAG: secretin N-terminal domain-containing protein, partial [Leptospirillum sp.]
MHLSIRQKKWSKITTFLFLIAFLSDGSRLHASTTPPPGKGLTPQESPGQTKDPLIIKPSTEPPLDPENSVSLNFRNVDISVLVRFMSNLMNKNIVMDERVKGKISILSPNRISIDRAFQIFKQSLRMKGFEAVTKKGMIFIVPANQAPQDRELFLFTLENTSAKSIAKTINSILAKGFQPPPAGSVSSGGLIGMVQIVPDSPSNSLIISATPHDYHLIKDLLRNLN